MAPKGRLVVRPGRHLFVGDGKLCPKAAMAMDVDISLDLSSSWYGKVP